jgi:hypothetical protein
MTLMQRQAFGIGHFCVVAVLVATRPLVVSGQAQTHQPSELFGVWHGTSICTDRVAAPACQDETIVYEFTAGPKPQTVHWKADKIVKGQREPMGELDLAYDTDDACWKGEFSSPRVRIVWCIAVTGSHIRGSAWLLPGKEKVRKVDLDKR